MPADRVDQRIEVAPLGGGSAVTGGGSGAATRAARLHSVSLRWIVSQPFLHPATQSAPRCARVRKSELDLAALAGEMRERKSALAPAAEERGKGKLASFFSGS